MFQLPSTKQGTLQGTQSPSTKANLAKSLVCLQTHGKPSTQTDMKQHTGKEALHTTRGFVQVWLDGRAIGRGIQVSKSSSLTECY